MKYYDKNIAALKKADEITAEWVESAPVPDSLSIVETKSGLPAPRLGETMLHSGYYPEKEAGKFAENSGASHGDTIVVFGFGFGYHLEALAQKAGRLIVIEPEPGLIKAALGARDIFALIAKVEIIPAHEFYKTAASIDYGAALWLDHEPAARIHKRLRDGLRELFDARKLAAEKRYKIMVIGPTYGGTTTTAVSAARAVQSLGFETDFVDNTIHKDEFFGIDSVTPNPAHRQALKAMFSNWLGETVAARADHVRPDIIIAMAQAPLAPENINKLKALGVPVVFWFVEDHRTLHYWSLVAPHYDYFFGIQQAGFLEKLADAGAPFAGYLPQAADPAAHKPAALTEQDKETYGADISFMGAGYPNRKKFFTGLLDMPLKIWGTEWDLATPLGQRVANMNKRLAPEEYVKIFNASKINLNLHSSTTHPGVDPVGDFVNPRAFEIAACGAFQLVDRRECLGEAFEPETEMVTFGDIDELREKIAHYLDSPDERARIAESSRRRVLAEHTFEHRVARLINIVAGRDGARIDQARAAGRSVNDVDAMIEKTDKPGLTKFLEQFRGQGTLKMSKVMEAISKGDGDLTREEAIFVMINQIVDQGAVNDG